MYVCRFTFHVKVYTQVFDLTEDEVLIALTALLKFHKRGQFPDESVRINFG